MTNAEKIALLEDMLEMDEGTLNENMTLKEVEVWDSMAALSLIVLCDEQFGKKLSGEQIVKFQTINDILEFME
ncbi:MAG: acyl carrier protein [Candidatus Delongbacteria bacterium]|jgi:acyl carrier protein|nr:acyl carrier protein [Candidatus Delongbacteria bacterium]